MNIYMLPSVLAFIFTCISLIYICKRETTPKIFYFIVLAFAVHHALEVLLYLEFSKNTQITLLLKIYHALSIVCLALILIYAKSVSKTTKQIHSNVIIGLSIIISALIMVSDSLISGSQSIGYSATAVKGPLYIVFQTFSTFLLIATTVTLILGYRRATSHLTQIQCAYVLIAFLPLILTSSGVILAMAAGYQINATMVVPIAFTLFLFITIKSEYQHKLTDLRRFLPNSPERKTSQEIMELFSSYARDEASYRDSINQIEKLLVMHKYSKNGKNASATAETMGMPRSSLYSIFNRLSIDLKDEK